MKRILSSATGLLLYLTAIAFGLDNTPPPTTEPEPPYPETSHPSADTNGIPRPRNWKEKHKQQQQADLRVLQNVWIAQENEEAKKSVAAHPRFSTYADHEPGFNTGLSEYGKDYAQLANPELADKPMILLLRAIETVQDKNRQKTYQRDFDNIKRSRTDRSWDYYALYGGIVRDEIKEQHRKEKNFAGYDALLIGWNTSMNHAWTTKQTALRVFGEDWVKTYEKADAPERRKMISAHYRETTGKKPDWQTYKHQRAAELYRLQIKAVKEQKAVTQAQAQAQAQKEARSEQEASALAQKILIGTGILLILTVGGFALIALLTRPKPDKQEKPEA